MSLLVADGVADGMPDEMPEGVASGLAGASVATVAATDVALAGMLSVAATSGASEALSVCAHAESPKGCKFTDARLSAKLRFE